MGRLATLEGLKSLMFAAEAKTAIFSIENRLVTNVERPPYMSHAVTLKKEEWQIQDGNNDMAPLTQLSLDLLGWKDAQSAEVYIWTALQVDQKAVKKVFKLKSLKEHKNPEIELW